MADHSSRIAVVTGAGSGIGAAVALALAGDGWVVVLAGRRPEALASVAAQGPELAGVLDPAPTDVADEASVRALFDRTVDRHGRVDLLFNNAGGWAPARELDTVPLAEWNAVVAVNLHLLVTIRCDLQFEARWIGEEKMTAPRDLAHRTKLDLARCIYQQAAGCLLYACRAELAAGDHAAGQPALAVPWARVR